jgi:hypothetical protein
MGEAWLRRNDSKKKRLESAVTVAEYLLVSPVSMPKLLGKLLKAKIRISAMLPQEASD